MIAVASLTREVPHATRSFFLIFPLEVFSALGLISFMEWLRSRLSKYKLPLLVGLFSVVLYSVFFYFVSYYFRFPTLYAKSWRAADKELSLWLQKEVSPNQKIIVDKSVGLIYSSLLFYQAFSPQEYQKTVVYSPDDSEGFSEVKSFGEYEFREIDWSKDYSLRNTYLVTLPDKVPSNIQPVKIIYYPERPVVINVKQEIISYPVTEKAYAIIKSQN